MGKGVGGALRSSCVAFLSAGAGCDLRTLCFWDSHLIEIGIANHYQECEELMAKGISGSGAGFDAKSMGRLGGRGPVPLHNPDPRKLRDVAVKVELCCFPTTRRLKRHVRDNVVGYAFAA